MSQGLCGLKNSGNDCYLNSTIQILVQNDLVRNQLTCDKKKIIQILSNKQNLSRTMTINIIKIIENMWTNKIYNVGQLKESFRGKTKLFDGSQHDANETLIFIIDNLCQELHYHDPKIENNINKLVDIKKALANKIINNNNNTKYAIEYVKCKGLIELEKFYSTNNSNISKIFSGMLLSTIKCTHNNCKYTSHTFQTFMHLVLPIPNGTDEYNIMDCIDEYFKQILLDKDNMWYCEKCGEYRQAIKKIDIWKYPKILNIQLNRFIFTNKNCAFVDYPVDELDLSNYISKYSPDEIKNSIYKLTGGVNHYGNTNSGHYNSIALNNNNWYMFDDTNIVGIDANKNNKSSIYLLMYQR